MNHTQSKIPESANGPELKRTGGCYTIRNTFFFPAKTYALQIDIVIKAFSCKQEAFVPIKNTRQ